MRMIQRLSALLAVTAIAGSALHAQAATPADIAALEARRAQHPRDPDVLIDIGTAFYRVKEYSRARDVFAAVLALVPNNFRAAVELGLANEGLGDSEAALEAYRRAAALKAPKRQHRDLEQRVMALTRTRLTAEARRAVEQERALANTPPLPNTIAVLPWAYLGADPGLKPLETGLAYLIVTDLSKVSRFILLERERVQALVDELKLAGEGRVEPATAARSGHLLRAARVVQGAIRETDPAALRLDANVVSTETSRIEATGTTADRLAELFAMEKSIVLGLLDRMGVVLSPAERRAITERPTADLQAFLAFSRGLEAEDRGDYLEAARLFREAARRDRGFRAAEDRAERSASLGEASGMTPERLADAVQEAVKDAVKEVPGGPSGGGISGRATASAVQTAALTGVQTAALQAALEGVAPSSASRLIQSTGAATQTLKSRLAEAFKQDDPVKIILIGLIHVIIPRP